MKKCILFCFLLASLPIISALSNARLDSPESTTNTPEAEKQYRAKYHIILVLDGPRYSETFGDSTCQYIPHMGKELVNEGTLFTNFRNSGSTYTNSGHTALTTGVHQRISNQGTQLPKNPSIFQYLLKQKGLDKRKAWIMASKGKLEMLANTKDKKWWNQYMPSTYCGVNGSGVGYPNDRDTWENFKSILVENKPVLTLINLLDIDVWGHANDWEKYLAAIKELDGFTLDLWQTIQNDPELRNQTALYVTNDHGRHLDGHKDGFKSHGDGCEGCRHISLLALGPDFEKGKRIDTPYDQIDLTASIAFMLNLNMPTGKGCPIGELTGQPSRSDN